MSRKIKTLLAVAALSIAVAEPALAMRCGTHVISSGQQNSPGKYEVLKRCGEPTERYGNTWIYKKGSVNRELRFDEQGRLLDIR
jgi:hypothetical protein